MTSAITDTFANALQKRVSTDALGEQPADAQGLETQKTNSDEADIPMTNPQSPPEETNDKDAKDCKSPVVSLFRCKKCKRQVQPEDLPGDRLPAEGGLIICKPCLSKTATLSKMFGKWPIPDFDELPDEEQAEFWRAGNTRKDLLNQLTKSVSEVTEKTKTNSVNGTYYPLSWYEKNGFDVEKIKKNCTDTEEHAVLGLTYRVDLRSVSKAETERVIKERLRKLIEDNKERAAVMNGDDATSAGNDASDEETAKKENKKKNNKNKKSKKKKNDRKKRKRDSSSSSSGSSKPSSSSSSSKKSRSESSGSDDNKPPKPKPKKDQASPLTNIIGSPKCAN